MVRVSACFVLSAAVLATAPAAAADPFANGALSFQQTAGHWSPAWFLCDATDRRMIAIVGRPDRRGVATIRNLTKPGLTETAERLRVGRADPGAGQIYFPLTTPDGRPAGALHAVNPGMYPPPAPALPSFTSIDGPAAPMRCRFDPAARLAVVTRLRTVVVSADARGRLRYTACAHAAAPGSAPTISLPGGTRRLANGQDRYSFANRGFAYRIMASRNPARPGAVLTVTQHGRTIQTEPALAYSIAAR